MTISKGIWVLAVLLALSAGVGLSSSCMSASAELAPGFAGADAGSSCAPGPCSGGGGFGRVPSLAPPPLLGPTVTASVPPPPLSGGTLLVTRDGNTAVVSDPDRDLVYVVDLAAGSVNYTIALQSGDEPGRLAEDGVGRVHVALRRGGALVTLDPSSGTISARRAVCPAPRGVAWDASSDLVWVACATGELVAFPSSSGAVSRSVVLERDLRDVVVQADGSLTVTRFRSAQVLRLAADGSVMRYDSLPGSVTRLGQNPSAPHVAWRTIAGPSPGSTVTVYQLESTASIQTNVVGGYGGAGSGVQGGPSGGRSGVGRGSGVALTTDGGPAVIELTVPASGPIVASAVTILGSDGSVLSTTAIPNAVLPVDVALSPDGTNAAIALAGNGFGPLSGVSILAIGSSAIEPLSLSSNVQVVAVAYDRIGNLIAQTREPATLLVRGSGIAPRTIPLSSISRADTGHAIFHAQAGGLIACASCHPEGGDDGHVWMLDGLPRRTPSLLGTISDTAPYHWAGEETTMGMLIDDVYTQRMSGAVLDRPQQDALTGWVQNIPAPPAPSWVDQSAAQRGKSLFQGSAGCATCHSGAKFTNNQTMDVGTGTDKSHSVDGGAPPTAFQVPPLIGVGWRTPLMHNGCAATIADRFSACGSAAHGSTAQLSSQDVSDLTAYLESL